MTKTESREMFWTLPELLSYSTRQYAGRRAIFAPHKKPILELTYAELGDEVRAFGAGLLRSGVKPGDHIALLSDNQPRWLISDLAITGIGAVDVPRGSDTALAEFDFILGHSGADVAIVQDAKLFDRLLQTETFNKIRLVVLLDDAERTRVAPSQEIARYTDIVERGRTYESLFVDAASKVTPETLATIVYTSGTTGSPKGVMLTHRNLMTQPMYVNLGYVPSPGDLQLCILPAWHAYERAAEYFGFYHGTNLTYSDKKYIREDLLKLCPHLLPCVPRIWEAVYKGIHTKLAAAPEKRQKLFRFFTKTGFRYVKASRIAYGKLPTREPVPILNVIWSWLEMMALFPMFVLGDKLVFSKIRQITGGRLKAAVSGGGSLAPYLDDFFEVVGVPILNGYGLTETSPVITVRSVDNNVRGSVGHVLEGTEISIRSENGEALPQGSIGEIWAKGGQVMQGYYQNQTATDKVLKDGWFASGDLGWITPAGDLVISGRAKDTIVLSSGENVEPEPIEDACRKSGLIQQIMLVGQDQKSLGALVVPDYSALAEALGIASDVEPADLVAHADAERVIKQAISHIIGSDGRFKAAEAVTKVHLLAEPFSEGNGLMTNTMKIKRNVVAEHYRNIIAGMYE